MPSLVHTIVFVRVLKSLKFGFKTPSFKKALVLLAIFELVDNKEVFYYVIRGFLFGETFTSLHSKAQYYTFYSSTFKKKHIALFNFETKKSTPTPLWDTLLIQWSGQSDSPFNNSPNCSCLTQHEPKTGRSSKLECVRDWWYKKLFINAEVIYWKKWYCTMTKNQIFKVKLQNMHVKRNDKYKMFPLMFLSLFVPTALSWSEDYEGLKSS